MIPMKFKPQESHIHFPISAGWGYDGIDEVRVSMELPSELITISK